MKSVAVLFARDDSIYKAMPCCDVWDKERDAKHYADSLPIIAHPPCRAWGQLSHMAKPEPHEKDLARLAVAMARVYGGIVEHPENSRLWKDQAIPRRGEKDRWGGWLLFVDQLWWGHKARKRTGLYVVGLSPRELPEIPYSMARPTHVVDRPKGNCSLPRVTKREREATPVEFARWLVDAVSRIPDENRQAWITIPAKKSA